MVGGFLVIVCLVVTWVFLFFFLFCLVWFCCFGVFVCGVWVGFFCFCPVTTNRK